MADKKRIKTNEKLRKYVDGLKTQLAGSTLWITDGAIHHYTAGSLLAELQRIIREGDG